MERRTTRNLETMYWMNKNEIIADGDSVAAILCTKREKRTQAVIRLHSTYVFDGDICLILSSSLRLFHDHTFSALLTLCIIFSVRVFLAHISRHLFIPVVCLLIPVFIFLLERHSYVLTISYFIIFTIQQLFFCSL